MKSKITGYELWRLEVPAGRLIGDNNCRYGDFQVLALCLKTACGLEAWGYAGTPGTGVFEVPAWYIQNLASEEELRQCFEREFQPHLSDQNPETSHAAVPGQNKDLHRAVQMALWDLKGKRAGLPIFRLIGGESARESVPGYGSLLDFHLSEEEAMDLAVRFVKRGFRAIKVKVGAKDVKRDIRRLQAIRQAVGPEVELTADANTIWNCETAVERLREFGKSGIRLGYIEDPLPHTDVEGFARLSKSIDIDVVGHDYASRPDEIRALLEVGGLKRVRGMTHHHADAMECVALAHRFGVPLIFGNSLFEMGVHFACAFPHVDRIEFSDLAWNEMILEPIKFEAGRAFAPERPGFGLDPRREALAEYRKTHS